MDVPVVKTGTQPVTFLRLVVLSGLICMQLSSERMNYVMVCFEIFEMQINDI